MFRIGNGYDVHRFAKGRRLILGGVEIPFERGLLGHSDADVLCHAIADAVLGAANAGDLGEHFPDSSEAYKGISSLLLLKKTGEIVRERGFDFGNLDAIIVAQRPRVAPYSSEMKKNIAEALSINISAVGVKATTTEGLGFAGREEGIAAYAVALLTSGTSTANERNFRE